MNNWKIRKYFGHYFHLLLVIILSIVFYKFMDNMNGVYSSISHQIGTVIHVLNPFLVGIIIAYILNPMVKWFEEGFLHRITILKKNPKYNRIISVGIVFLILLLVITMIVSLVVPRIAVSLKDLMSTLPTFIHDSQNKVMDWIQSVYKSDVYNIEDVIKKNLNSLFVKGSQILESTMNNLLSSVIAVTSKTLNLLLSLVVSFYILVDKDKLLRGMERFLRAILKDEQVIRVKRFCKDADNTFVRFVIGKSIDSFIIGIIAYTGLYLIKSPYVLLIGTIVMISNMIPYFGPLVGALVGFVFVSFYDPIKAVWVLVFLFGLQQFDGLYLGPKILGDKLGLGPLWIILSIVVGGSLFGVVGMFLGAPAIAVLFVAINKFIDRRLENKVQR